MGEKKITDLPLADQIQFLESLKQQWMDTVDAILNPLMIVGSDYRIEKANIALAKLAGKRRVPDILRKKCHQVFFGKKTPCKGCLLKDCINHSKQKDFALSDEKRQLYFEVTAQPIHTQKGDGALMIYRDRTEAKALERKLLQSEKLASIGLLAGGVAHEINNPLGGILIFSQMVLREMAEDSPHYQDIIEIERAAQRCKDIVRNLLDFSRMGDIDPKKSLKPVRIKEASDSALKFALVGATKRTIEVEQDWPDDPLKLKADKNKLIQLFLNIYQNAVQAMPHGGTLTISGTLIKDKGQKFLKLAIQDEGEGISEQHLNKIFDPFFTSKPVGEGTGLGLSICHGIVKELLGDIEVVSKKGEFTRFTIHLPLMEQDGDH